MRYRHLGIAVLISMTACTATTLPPTAEIPQRDVAAPDEPADPVQLVVFSSKTLPSSLASAAKKIPGVLAAGPQRNGLVNLVNLSGADRSLPRRPSGAVLPVAVLAPDQSVLAALPATSHAAAVLRRGKALVPRSAAALRGIGPGDALDLANGSRRVRVEVGAIVDDGRSFRAEVILPAETAVALGLGRVRRLLVAVEAAAALDAEAAITRAIGSFPARVRMRTPGGSGTRGGGLLSMLELKTTFGEFWYRPLPGNRIAIDPAWRSANIVTAAVPVLGRVTCHRKIIPQLTAAMNEVAAAGLARQVRTFDGCYNPRMQVSDSDALSRHAYGVALDINAATNPYGGAPRQDPRLVQIMERWGFTWGGTWTVPDAMHFEFARFPGA